MNTLSEYYSKETEDYSLTVFPIAVPQQRADSTDSTVLVLSDTHYGYWFDGAGGYSGAERHEKMIEFISEYAERYDCVIFNGDMAFRDGQLNGAASHYDAPDRDRNWISLVKEDYFDALARKGLPYFAINASHDSMLKDEFQEIFGYEHNYVVLAGTTAYICCDTYSGERLQNGHTAMADIPADFACEVKKLLRRGYVENAFIVCHFATEQLSNLVSLLAEPKVYGTLCGHSHYNEVWELGGKPMLHTGHFSRADVKQKTWGLAFSPFAPVKREMPDVIDFYGNPHPDYSATGSPWQARVVESRSDDTGTLLESYMVYPEETYGPCIIENRHFDGFYQPYAEARPSFLGKDAPIDKSYWLFRSE